jgi:methylmalonyl-CoA/ethylmalonyl-CoA epimerase
MERFGLAFDHLGLATRSPDRAVAFLEGLGYQPGAAIYDPLQKVNLILCANAFMPAVEVIYPADQRGPLDAILAGNSESFYHLCFRSHDLAASLDAMRRAGHRVVQAAAPLPAILFGNKHVSFYLVRGFGLVEVIED